MYSATGTRGERSPGQRLRGQLLLLRGRSGLTQRELAAHLGISEQAVQKWEQGQTYPSPARLQALIALYMQRQVFPEGREEAEARALWALLHGAGGPRTPPFDTAWFATLLPAAGDEPPEWPAGSRPDWGEAPDVAAFQGRTAEVETLHRWLVVERCRVVALLGLGGIGKTTLATRTAQDVAPHFDGLCWRSLRNARPPEEWLGMAIAALAPIPPVLPAGLPARLALLLELLRERRCLLVLDNLETVLEPGESTVRYRAGYEDYGDVLRQVGERAHQSSLLLTSREAPPELALLALLAGETAPVRTLRLGGLDLGAARTLLADRGLEGDDDAWAALVERYGGNPLALLVVGQSIAELFGGDIRALLAYATETSGAVFGSLRRLLDEQFVRLSPLEQSLLYWLAVEREPVGVAHLAADLTPGADPGAVLEALEALGQRSLLERGAQGGTHTLQPVVLEYVSERLVAALAQEIVAAQPGLLVRHAVVQATSKDYVRYSQERLLAGPLLERVVAASGGAESAERQLAELLQGWRGRPRAEQGYGPGNVVNLLRLRRGDLRGLDLARLSLRQAYLAEVEAQDASLAGAHLAEAVLAEAFNDPTCVALSADGAYLVAGTYTGEVYLWRAADRTLRATLRGHEGAISVVASTSGDGHIVASGSLDGTVRLWTVPEGHLLATLRGHAGAVWGVALSADGRLLASAGLDGTVRLWMAARGHQVATLQGHTGGVRGVALSADGHIVASSGDDGTVRLWMAARGHQVATLQGHTGGVWGVALSAAGQMVASASLDGTVKLWEMGSGRPLATVQGYSCGVWGVALSAAGHIVAGGSLDGTARVWEAGSGQPLATLRGHRSGVRGVALSGDGHILASAGMDGTVRLWTVPAGHLLATLEGQSGPILGVALSEDGRLLASGGDAMVVTLREVGSGRVLATLQGHTGAVTTVALSADGHLVASGSFDGTVRLWAVAPTGGSAPTGGYPVPAGHLLATLEGQSGPILGVALSEDGRLLASGGDAMVVTLREVGSGRVLATLQGHTGAVTTVALSADGHLVASGSVDGTARLWEAASGQPLATLQGHSGAVWGVALSRDGQIVASASRDGTVRLWEASSGACLRALRADRPYERLDITGLTGVTEAQRAALLALGAIEQAPASSGAPVMA